MMAWSNDSVRRAQLPPDWNKIRERVLERDGRQCTWRLPSGKRCPRAATDVDHKNNPNDHRDQALQSLCRHHHDKKTGREALAGRRIKRTGRPEEPHPGMIRP